MEVRPGYKLTEAGVIPEDWVARPLADLGTFKNGINKGKEDFGHGFPFINLMDVFGIPRNSRVPADFDLVNSTAAERKQYELKAGDVLFVRSSVKPAGVGLTTLVPDDLPETVFSGFLIRFRDDGLLERNFKEHCFWDEGFRRRLITSSTVSANTNINQDALKRLQVSFPQSRSEQDAIATALSDVDALLAGLHRLIAKKRDIKQAAMQQLLTGKTRLPGFSGEWVMKRLGEIADIDPENLGAGTAPNYSFKYISLEDVDFGVLRSFAEQVFAFAPSRARRKLQRGDVLVSTVRPNLKSHLLFDQAESDWVCSTGFAVVRAKRHESHPGYLFAHLFAHDLSCQIDALLTGSNYPAINSADVRRFEVPAPAYEEQAAIATVLSDMDAELIVLEAQRDKTQALKQGMMQELLTGRTRLVPREAEDA